MQKHSKKVALIDDHQLFRKGIAELINSFNSYFVLFECSSGIELKEKLHPGDTPDIIIMDVNMPAMDGFKTMEWLQNSCPDIPVLILSMLDDENTIVKMLKHGVKGYLLKDSHPNDLQEAMNTIINNGFYYTDLVTGKLINSLNNSKGSNGAFDISNLSEREISFLKLCCTELSYKEMASQLFISPRTVDGYREKLFEKLEIKSRSGLVIFAIKNGIVKV